MLDEFNSFDNLIENIDEVKNPRIQEKIKNDKDLAILSKKLVTIDLNVPVELNINELETRLINILSSELEPAIILHSDKSVEIEHVVKVMDIAYRNNYKIVLATDPS